jgi:hypothetical protein
MNSPRISQVVRTAGLALSAAWIALAVPSFARSTHTQDSALPRIPRTSFAEQVAVEDLGNPPVPDLSPARSPDAAVPHERTERDSPRAISTPASDERYSRVYWDTAEDGTIWVRGRLYKASFGADGATYYPLFGSEQPRHEPLHLSLELATSDGDPIELAPLALPFRDGDRVVYRRGAFVEVYEVGVEELEQTFVVRERPRSDLRLHVALESQMTMSESETGIEFSTPWSARARSVGRHPRSPASPDRRSPPRPQRHRRRRSACRHRSPEPGDCRSRP